LQFYKSRTAWKKIGKVIVGIITKLKFLQLKFSLCATNDHILLTKIDTCRFNIFEEQSCV